jgi:flagellar hook-associated protein 2
VSSPITFSGFNNIDFGTVINSLMTEASAPLTALQTRQTNLQGQASQVTALTSQVSSLEAAASQLSTSDQLASFTVNSTDSTAVSAVAGSSAVPGHYDVVVQELARAQVTASASTAPDANTTVVATGGTLTIKGVDVKITQPVTLQGLADAINGTTGSPVSASVVQSDTNAYRLVLTSTNSGTANAFTVTNGLTGGAGVSFTDTNGDGVSGDSTADNAVQATNASVLVNNVAITSSTNTLTTAIPGTTLTLLKKDPSTSIGIDIAADSSALKSKLNNFVSAYNTLVSFAQSEDSAAAGGDPTSLSRDPLLRQLRNSLRSALTTAYSNDGSLQYVSQLGVEFTRTGTLQLNDAVFDAAVQNGAGDAAKLLVGTTSAPGAFASLDSMLTQYTNSSGLLSDAQQQITNSIATLSSQISDMQARLALQRASLQKEFTAADLAMSQLQSQSGSLAQLGSSIGSGLTANQAG